jgi:hypothetical protein
MVLKELYFKISTLLNSFFSLAITLIHFIKQLCFKLTVINYYPKEVSMSKLLGGNISIINIGSEIFTKDLLIQDVKVAQVNWQPLQYSEEVMNALTILDDFKDIIHEANQKVAEIINSSEPFLIGIDNAINVIPNMTQKTILHAGPPTTFSNMAGPVKGAVLGALIFEGLACNLEEAELLSNSGEIIFSPCNEHDAVGPMAGIISASMPVHIVENRKYGNRAYCSVNEGLGKVLRFGANSEDVINRLRWIRDEFMPVFKQVLKLSGPIDLKGLINQGLQMGDECHNRNRASTSLFIREIIAHFFEVSKENPHAIKAMDFINKNDHYFLNLAMPAAKSSLDAAMVVKNSSIVTTMARNGVDFGIRLAGTEKNTWFVGTAEVVNGLLFAGYTPDDCCPDLGDSAITETYGIGGFAMAASPAIVNFVGGTVKDAIEYSKKMYAITTSKSPSYSIPALNFLGNPVGIDIISVIETGILPVINTGIAHKSPGVGQVGAGVTTPPVKCFEQALVYLAKELRGK